LASLLVGASPASAHAQLISSNPTSGAALDTAPNELTLQFSESVTQVPEAMKLLASDGAAMPLGPVTVTGHTLHVAMPGTLPDAGYVFVYRVISADSHPVAGAITFTVGETATAASASTVTDAVGGSGSHRVSVLSGLNRAVGFAGVILLVGVPVFVVVCRREVAVLAGDAAVRGLTLAGGGLVTLTALAGLPLQGARSVGGGVGDGFGELDTVLDTAYGKAALARIAFVVLLLVALATAARMRSALEVAGVAAVAVLATFARSGHPAVAEHSVLTMADDVAHFGAVALWIGGLVVLALRVLPLDRSGPASVDTRAVLARWSPLAMSAVVVLALTGSIQAWRELRSVESFYDTAYGRWILVKIAGLVLMLALAEFGRRRIRAMVSEQPRPMVGASLGAALAEPVTDPADGDLLRRSVALELVLAAGVLAATSILVVQTPGAHAIDQHMGNMAGASMADMPGMDMGTADLGGPGPEPTSTSGPVTASVELPNDVRVEVVADPARAGSAVLTLNLRSLSGEVIDPPEVTITAEQSDAGISPITLTPLRAEAGRFTVDAAQLLVAGTWRLTLTVRTTDVDAGVGTVEIPLAPA
jgi:copper transport protein